MSEGLALTQNTTSEEYKMNIVLLTDGTVGKAKDDAKIGDTVTVDLHDENGNFIKATGVVEEILE